MRTRKAVLTILSILCLTAAAGCLFVACNNSDDCANGAVAFICVDINPSVELIVDANDVVLGISGENTDAKVMLYNEGGLVGVPLNIALNNLMSLAVSCGYLNPAANIGLSVASAKEDLSYETVKQQLVSSALKCGAAVEISSADENDVALATELDILISQNPVYADVSVQRFRLMKRAASVCSFDGSRAMPVEELIALIQTVWSETTENLDASLANATTRARYVYEGARLFAKDSLYVTYFFGKSINADNTLQSMQYRARTLYASRYVALRSAYEYLKHCRKLIDDYISNPILSEEDLRPVYGLLSPHLQMQFEEFASALQCAGSGITAKNLNSFVNTLYRTAEPNKKARIADLYKTIKTEILEVFETDEVIGNTHAVLNDILNATVDLVSANNMQDLPFTDSVTVDASIFSFINTNTLENLDASIQVLGEMTKAAYDDMKLTDGELSQIEALSDTIALRVETAQEECAEKINGYKLMAEEWFEKAKNAVMPQSKRA